MSTNTIDFKEVYKAKIKSYFDGKHYNKGIEYLKDLTEAYDSEIKYMQANYDELVRVSKKMRELQIEYFKTRDQNILKLAKKYEELCDKCLYLINDKKY